MTTSKSRTSYREGIVYLALGLGILVITIYLTIILYQEWMPEYNLAGAIFVMGGLFSLSLVFICIGFRIFRLHKEELKSDNGRNLEL